MKKTIPVVDMACSACSANVEKKLYSLAGVNSPLVYFASVRPLLDFNPDVISLDKMKQEVNNIGYDLLLKQTEVWMK